MNRLESCSVTRVGLSLPFSGHSCLVMSPRPCEESNHLLINLMSLRRLSPVYRELSATSLLLRHKMPMCMCSPSTARHQACKVYHRVLINSGALSTCTPGEKVHHNRKSTSSSSPALRR